MHQTRFEKITAEAVGVRNDDIVALLNEYITGDLACEVHAFAFLRHGRLVAEGAFSPFKMEERHEIFSCTKMLIGTAVGFAEAEGLLRVSDRVVDLLPDCLPKDPDPRLFSLTVEHLLAMSAGFAAHGVHMTSRGHLPEVSSLREKVTTVLARPFDRAPGEGFGYDNLCTYLLSVILTRVTGLRAEEYLAPRLFAPLGIPTPALGEDEYGISHGYMGARLTVEEFALLGQLYLDDGIYGGRRVLPEGWCARASACHTPSESGVGEDWCQGYGYQLWRGRHGTYRFCGAYGQMCVIMPELDAVFAVFSGCNGDRIHCVLDAFYRHLLTAMNTPSLPASRVSEEDLHAYLRRLAVSEAYGTPSPAVGLMEREAFAFAEDAPLRLLRLSFSGDAVQLFFKTREGEEISFAAGLSRPMRTPLEHAVTAFDGSLVPHPTVLSASAVFLSPSLLAVTVHTLHTPFAARLLFDGEDGTADYQAFRY